MKLDCFEKQLSLAFYKYGKFVARHPLPFLIIPIIVSIGLSIGILKLELIEGTEELYTPRNGPAKDERDIVQDLFPENDSYYFEESRRSDLPGYLRICFISDTDNGNILIPDVMKDIIDIDNAIKNHKVRFNDVEYTFADVCGKWKGNCSENTILSLLDYTPGNIIYANLTYPVHNDQYFIGMEIGGVTVNDNGYITSAKAMLFQYYVAYQTDHEVEVGDAWITQVSSFLLDSKLKEYTSAKASIENSHTMDEELARATGDIIMLFSIAYTILMTFAAVSTTMKDWVRCKTWVAMGGEVAVVMAVGSAIGLLSLCGVHFTSTVGTMPFLIVGIGLDDMFVIVSSWRHTNYLLDVEERMGKCLEKAAVSITLTSLTDALAFAIGAYTSFLSIELFCLYTLVAVIFCYIYVITFLSACMVFSGQREFSNRHVFTCMKATAEENIDGQSRLRRILCIGGDPILDNNDQRQRALDLNEERIKVPQLSIFLGTTYADFLIKKPTKLMVLLSYLAYLGFSIWGCVTLQEGLQLQNLAPDDSYVVPFYEIYEPYFLSQWGPKTMVVLTESLDYSNPDIRQNVHGIVDEFQRSKYFLNEDELTESWLRDFETYLSDTGQSPQNLSHFINILKSEFFLSPPLDRYMLDVDLNDENTEILASRFLVPAKGIENAVQEKELVLEARMIATAQDYAVTVYHAAFIYYDQYTVVVSNTIRNLSMAAVCMLVVALILLPHPLAVVWVTVSVVSICTGVVGFMVFWDVSMDSISMINLTMCIGFSVDFSGHICYHYTISNGTSPKQKVREALQYLGLPILQGGVSTILGVCVLAFSNAYIFRTFFKLVLLVMIFGLYHAVIVLPVVLSTIGPGVCTKSTSTVDLSMGKVSTYGESQIGDNETFNDTMNKS